MPRHITVENPAELPAPEVLESTTVSGFLAPGSIVSTTNYPILSGNIVNTGINMPSSVFTAEISTNEVQNRFSTANLAERNAMGRPISSSAWEDEMYSLYLEARTNLDYSVAERILMSMYHANRNPF